jgi:hypothetical protein
MKTIGPGAAAGLIHFLLLMEFLRRNAWSARFVGMETFARLSLFRFHIHHII